MSPVCLEVFHDTLRFFVRCTVAVIVIACLVCHDHDTLLYQPVKALLQRGVHFGDSGCKPFGIEAVIVHCSFPVFGELVLLSLMLSIILNFNDLFFIPSVRFLSVGTALGFYGCGTRLSVQLHTEGFSCQLLFLRKGRICRKFTLSRRIKRDGRPLHLIKPNRG